MRRLIVSIGNSLRGDDAVAHRAVSLCHEAATDTSVAYRHLYQLVPEIAAELIRVDAVVFVDADTAHRGPPSLQRLVEPRPRPGAATVARDGGGSALVDSSVLDHSWSPGQIVALARRLYGFQGEAWVCRIPVAACELGEGLSGIAMQAAGVAAVLLLRWVATAAQPAPGTVRRAGRA